MKKYNILSIVVLSLISTLVPLYLYVTNYIDTPVLTFIRTAVISLVLFLLFLLIAWLIFKKPLGAAIFTAVAYFLCTIYGAIYSLLQPGGSIFSHHKILAPVLILLIVLWGVAVWKLKKPARIANILSFVIVAFIIIQSVHLFQIVIAARQETTAQEEGGKINQGMEILSADKSADNPDVYYIILDMYTREDLLKSDFDYDNADFLNSLRSLGFYIGDCSRSNYMITEDSLASSLNMTYLQDASSEFTPENTDKSLLVEMIKDSTVFKEFKALGYKTISFETGYNFTEITNVDQYLAPSYKNYLVSGIQPFELMAMEDSIIKILFDTHIPYVDDYFNQMVFPFNDHVERTYYMLNTLKEISNDSDATFTFAHITVPHQPFVFLPDGEVNKDRRFYSGESREPVSEDLYNEGYVNQVQFIDNQILEVVKTILANSSKPPIIIIQGDHGAKIDHRPPILNAYYFPGEGSDNLYETISPVNSFRLLFDTYYGADFSILDDKSYVSSYSYPYDWNEVFETPEQCKAGSIH